MLKTKKSKNDSITFFKEFSKFAFYSRISFYKSTRFFLRNLNFNVTFIYLFEIYNNVEVRENINEKFNYCK